VTRVASSAVWFWIPASVLKWYFTQHASPLAFTHLKV
jgi:hypothetical protein